MATTKNKDMTTLITAGIALLSQLVPYIARLIEKAKQNKELTTEQAAAYRNQLVSLFAQAHWIPDPITTTTAPCTGDDCAPPACTGDDCKVS